MFSVVGLLLLAMGFAVLLQTFAWISRLVARRARPTAQEGEPPIEERPSFGVILHGANYGLILGILACLLFKVWAPLMLALSAAGIGFSVRTLVEGWRGYQIVVWRALTGLGLGLASVGLHYLNLTGQLPPIDRLLSQ